MIISVTSDHIRRGRPGSSCYGPVSLAISAAVSTRYVKVEKEEIVFILAGDNKSIHCFTPPKVQNFMLAFDCGQFVAPFKFDLPLDVE